MTTAPAPLHRPRPATPRRRRSAPLRVVRPIDALDLDAAMADALAPHAASPADAHAPVHHVHVDDHGRRAGRVRRNRRRAVVVAMVLATAGAVAIAVGAGANATGPDVPPAPVGATVTLEPGQTLWDVATEVTPAGGDVRGTVAEIRRLNELDGGPVPAWTPLMLPAD